MPNAFGRQWQPHQIRMPAQPCPLPQVVFLVPWMWFGAIFLAALAALGFTVAAYTCVHMRELAMPLGSLALLTAAGAQLPGFVLLSRLLDGDASVRVVHALAPMAVSWALMWASALVVCSGLRWKERLRASLAASGRTWTMDDVTNRSVMRADVRETQRQVDTMNDAQLAKVTRKLMQVLGAWLWGYLCLGVGNAHSCASIQAHGWICG